MSEEVMEPGRGAGLEDDWGLALLAHQERTANELRKYTPEHRAAGLARHIEDEMEAVQLALARWHALETALAEEVQRRREQNVETLHRTLARLFPRTAVCHAAWAGSPELLGR